jgi:hypothetical protein
MTAADLVGNDKATVQAGYGNKYVLGGNSVWSNPTGPLAQLFGAIPGGAFGLGIIQAILGLIGNIVGPIPIVGTIYDDFAAFLGFTHTTAVAAQTGNQNIIDALIGGITGDPSSTDNPVQMLGYWVQQLQQSVQGAWSNATSAFNLTTQFGGLLHQAVNDLESLPVFTDAENFLSAIGTTIQTFLGNISTSLSPQNPSIAQSNSQIGALWAALTSTQTGIRYVFDSAVALTAPLAGGVLAAWVTPTGQTLPTVVNNYVEDSSTKYGIWNASTLQTDQFRVDATILDITQPGINEIICCVNSKTAPTQYVSLQLSFAQGFGIFFGTAMSIYTYTGLGTGAVQRTTQAGLTFNVNDVIGIQVSGNVFTMFQNGSPVGTPWTDSGAVVTHGSGNREVGLITCVSGPGPGLGNFVAYDY